jgi:hypothetical protein
MPDCRIWIPDRKKFEIVELRREWMAELPLLMEKYRSGTPNFPSGPGLSRRAAFSLFEKYYDRHHYLWMIDHAIALFKFLKFEVLETHASSPSFISVFERDILPRWADKPFRDDGPLGPFVRRLFASQQRGGFPLLDYSFILVAKNPGIEAVARAVESLECAT